ncbi:MAG TPA: aminotransferase [Thermohalobaculum sp.]|nr:aminotransferase [Thermohalobaculum sp.]
MPTATNPNLAAVFAPPVMEARRWVADAVFPPGRPLLNFSQAAPVDPPPQALRDAMARAVREDAGIHLYGPVLGDRDLREAIARRWSMHYGAPVEPDQVAVTAGCNQAFCAAVAALAAPGEAVLLPVPWYFNHKMWLDMSGIEARAVPCGDGMLPDLDAARTAMDGSVRAIVLVTPNNPTGAEYPAGLMDGFHALARAHDAALIVDETYRDFHSASGPPHALFSADDWPETLVHLYSFSKVYRLTGHRTGAIVTGERRLAEIEKFLDTVAICAPRVGQFAALEGLRTLDQWVAAERAEFLSRRATLERLFAERLPDWRVHGAGAYFAWVEPPFDLGSDRLARRLVDEQSLLVLPGTMFVPEGAEAGRRQLRIAFANADSAGLEALVDRLAAFAP